MLNKYIANFGITTSIARHADWHKRVKIAPCCCVNIEVLIGHSLILHPIKHGLLHTAAEDGLSRQAANFNATHHCNNRRIVVTKLFA